MPAKRRDGPGAEVQFTTEACIVRLNRLARTHGRSPLAPSLLMSKSFGLHYPPEMLVGRIDDPVVFSRAQVPGAGLSRANDPVGQRARYMTLETISTLSDDPAVSLAAIA